MLARFISQRSAGAGAIVMTAVAASACTVGPDYRPPDPPAVTSLSPTPISTLGPPGADRQRFVEGLELPRRWWELFHCRALETVIARAVTRSPSIEAAKAAVRIADANVRAEVGSLLPQVSASAGAAGQQPGAAQGAPAGSPYTVSTGQVSVSYSPDVFGLERRRIESLTAQAEVQRLELEAAYLTLTARLTLAIIDEAALREQIKSAEEIVAIASSIRDQLKILLATRDSSRMDVAAQDAALAQFQQALYALRKQLAANRDLSAALSGGFAAEPIPETFTFACLHLPPALPLTLPATIVQRRPDVRAAAANVHQATAEIGVAVASRFPQLTFNSNAGGNLLTMAHAAAIGPALLWSVAGSVTQTLFDGMTLEQRERAAEAGLDRSLALYRGTVISAFQSIADVLQAMRVDADALTAAERGAKSAEINLKLTRELLTRGEANTLQLLSAQQAFAQARASLAQARAARLLDTVLLFQALGGGISEEGKPAPRIPARWVTNIHR